MNAYSEMSNNDGNYGVTVGKCANARFHDVELKVVAGEGLKEIYEKLVELLENQELGAVGHN